MRACGWIVALVAVLSVCAQAAELDWSAVDYAPAGGTLATFNNVDGTTVDMTFQWSGSTDNFLTNWGSPPISLPDDDPAASQFGMSALWYAVNFNDANDSISLVITFSETVTGVRFDLYDIDGVSPIFENTRIKGFLDTVAMLPDEFGCGSDVAVQILPIGTLPVSGVVFSNLGQYDTNPPNDAHWAYVVFDGPLNKIGMQYKCSTGLERGQLIGNVTFIPEPGTLLVLSLGGLLGLRRKRA